MGSSPVPRTSVAARRRSPMPARNRAGILLPLLRLRHAAQKHGRSLYIPPFRPANCVCSLRFCLAANSASSKVAVLFYGVSGQVPRTAFFARRRSRMPARNRAGILLPLLRLRHASQKHGRSLYADFSTPANCVCSLRFCLAVNSAPSKVAALFLRRERTNVPHRFLCKATVANACTESCRHFASTPAAPPRRAKTRTLIAVQASGVLPGRRKAKAAAFRGCLWVS